MGVKTYIERTIGDFKDTDGTFIERYKRSLEALPEGTRRILDVFSRAEDGTICGSNSFALILAHTHGLLRLATPEEFSMAFNDDSESWRECYRDVGILFNPMNFKGNELLNQSLERALKDANVQIGNVPLFLPFTSFDLREPAKSEKSNYGLVHVVTNPKEIIEAPMLVRDAQIRNYSILEKGLPVPDENGKYKIYLTDYKVAGLVVSWGLGFLSGGGGLADSVADGRVVSVSDARGVANDAQKNYDAQVLRINQARDDVNKSNQEVADEAIRKLRR